MKKSKEKVTKMFERALSRAGKAVGDSLRRGVESLITNLFEALVDLALAGVALMVALVLAILAVVLWAMGMEVGAVVAVLVLLVLTLAVRADPGGWVARRGLQEAGDLAIALEVAALTLLIFDSTPYTWLVIIAAFAMACCSNIR